MISLGTLPFFCFFFVLLFFFVFFFDAVVTHLNQGPF